MTAVVKKKDDPSKIKGELMESNADAMEVSSFSHFVIFFSSFLSRSNFLDKSTVSGTVDQNIQKIRKNVFLKLM